MTPTVAGIVLAAGNGSRMGCTKQLLPFRGKTVLECVVDAALASCLSSVTVVIGHDAERIQSLLRARNVTTVLNPDYMSGQGSSTRAGTCALGDEVDAALFLLGDQPLVTPKLIDTVLDAYRAHRAPIVLPTYEGRRGNPALFDRETFPRLRSLSGGATARVLFDEFGPRILKVPVADPAIHFDIDTEEDYQRLRREHSA